MSPIRTGDTANTSHRGPGLGTRGTRKLFAAQMRHQAADIDIPEVERRLAVDDQWAKAPYQRRRRMDADRVGNRRRRKILQLPGPEFRDVALVGGEAFRPVEELADAYLLQAGRRWMAPSGSAGNGQKSSGSSSKRNPPGCRSCPTAALGSNAPSNNLPSSLKIGTGIHIAHHRQVGVMPSIGSLTMYKCSQAWAVC